jgi:hypothetical protein
MDLSNFDGVPNLRSLVVRDNLIKFFQFRLVQLIHNLVHLDLSNNQLMRVKSAEFIKRLPIQSAMFDGNVCIDENFEGEKEYFEDFVEDLITCEP